MTLLELLRLLKRFWIAVVTIPILFGLVALVATHFLFPVNYVATSKVVVSAEAAAVGAMVSPSDDASVMLSSEVNTTAKTVTLSAESENPDSALAVANDAAEDLAPRIAETFPDVTYQIMESDAAIQEDDKALVYVLAAVIAGLFLAVACVVICDMARNPLRSDDEVESYGLQVIATISKNPKPVEIETLCANASIVSNDAKVLCVLPVANPGYSTLVAGLLSEAATKLGKRVLAIGLGGASSKHELESVDYERISFKDWQDSKQDGSLDAKLEGFKAGYDLIIVETTPFDESIGALYGVQSAESTVIVVKEYVTTHSDLQKTLHQLKIANVEPAGVVKLES